jgi:hypothetical protein
MLLEKRDLSFPGPRATRKPAYEKERKSLPVDLIVEIDVPDVYKRHADLTVV